MQTQLSLKLYKNHVLKGISILKLLQLLKFWTVLSQGILGLHQRGMETQQQILSGMTILFELPKLGQA